MKIIKKESKRLGIILKPRGHERGGSSPTFKIGPLDIGIVHKLR